MPKVSIIVPCWGVEQYLDRCVKSLVNQTLRDIEIILVDDESPDRVPKMCDAWAEKDSRIKVVHKKNGGLGFACNSGLDVATGDYVAFCDSDDWVELETYESLYVTACKTKADAVYSGIQTIDDAGVVRLMNQPKKFEVMTEKDRILEYAMDMICSRAEDPVESHIAMSAKIVLYNRSLIEKFNLRFESERKLISEDLIWNIDILGRSSIVVTLPQTFYYYYNNTNSISKKVRLDRFMFFKSIRLELLRRTRMLDFPGLVVERIDRMYLRHVRSDIRTILMSKNSFFFRYKLALERAGDSMTQDVIKSYPTNKLTKKQQVIIELIKQRMIIPIYLLCKFMR